MKKGATVFYVTHSATIRARVERVHGDGSVTVKALFRQERGKDVPFSYLGFNYRVHREDLRFAA